VRQPDEVRRRIGLTGQYAALDENLTGFENLEMIGRLYHLPRAQARHRADELLERFNLSDAASRLVKTYSGGMGRRLDLAASLVASPPVLFLDEPTTGLDPRSRLGMWDLIKELAAGGTTLLMTTQYLDEADRLADRIAVIDVGRVIAVGSVAELKAQVGGERLAVTVAEGSNLAAAARVLTRIGNGAIQIDDDQQRVSIAIENSRGLLSHVVGELVDVDVQVDDVGLHRPTLDDVFLSLTGHTVDSIADSTNNATDGVPSERFVREEVA
jgi:ABC-2 type transport system ATP-binding protein